MSGTQPRPGQQSRPSSLAPPWHSEACWPAARTGSPPHTALVIDAGAGRDGRELVDARLRQADAEVRLARTSTEARADVRYFAAQGYRVIVNGPPATGAAAAAAVPAVRAGDLTAALAAISG